MFQFPDLSVDLEPPKATPRDQRNLPYFNFNELNIVEELGFGGFGKVGYISNKPSVKIPIAKNYIRTIIYVLQNIFPLVNSFVKS